MDLCFVSSCDEFYGNKRVARGKFAGTVCPGVDEFLIRNNFLERSVHETGAAISTICFDAILSADFQFLRRASARYLIAAKPLRELFRFGPRPVHFFNRRLDRPS